MSTRSLRNVESDRYLVAVAGTGARTTHDNEGAARSIAEGMSAWPEHIGKQVTVTDRDAPPRETKSVFGGTRTIEGPDVIAHYTARRVA